MTTGRYRRLTRLESRLYRAEAYEQRCAGVHIPWDTRSSNYDIACAVAIAEQARNSRAVVILPGKAASVNAWTTWANEAKGV
jgi:hypothetical protein